MRMRGWCRWIPRGVGGVLGIALSAAALAQTLPRLPQDFILPRGQGSPGTVTFRHQTHVDAMRPDCTMCHPALFKILESGVPFEGGSIGHASLQTGRQCWACHNDKAAFGPGSCPACHRGR
jgi:c(7)-type cytochrome triheme protein